MGMREEVVENILKDNNKTPKHGSGVGVINVHSRIKLMFGDQYGLSIESEADEGTKVTIHIPAIPFNEENRKNLENQNIGRRMKMKKNKTAFLITEIILCMLAVLFTYRIFDHETPEKKIAVIVENSGDKNMGSLINGLKSAGKSYKLTFNYM